MKAKKMARQGDVLLMRISAKAAELEPAPKDARGLVLAEGETSGHYHAVFGKGAKLCRYKSSAAQRVVVVPREGCTVRVVGGGAGGVDRHTPISLASGKWAVRIQRAWTSELASRRVTD